MDRNTSIKRLRERIIPGKSNVFGVRGDLALRQVHPDSVNDGTTVPSSTLPSSLRPPSFSYVPTFFSRFLIETKTVLIGLPTETPKPVVP